MTESLTWLEPSTPLLLVAWSHLHHRSGQKCPLLQPSGLPGLGHQLSDALAKQRRVNLPHCWLSPRHCPLLSPAPQKELRAPLTLYFSSHSAACSEAGSSQMCWKWIQTMCL